MLHPLPDATTAARLGHLAIGSVALRSHDAQRLAAYYEDVIGLARLAATDGAVTLGVGARPFLTVRHDPAALEQADDAVGLFHTAFLLPSRSTLGAFLAAADAKGAQFTGLSDHSVSEAAYLRDPDGNGIEVYADRPKDTWPRRGDGYDLTTRPMDVRAVLGAVTTDDAASGLPADTVIGHVHLQVSDLAASTAFWSNGLALERKDERPGAVFLAAGDYHHHVALNTWRSRGAPRRGTNTVGLDGIELIVRDPQLFARQRDAFGAVDGTISVTDPNGFSVALSLQPKAAGCAP